MKFMGREGDPEARIGSMRIPLRDPSLVRRRGSLQVLYQSARRVVGTMVGRVSGIRVDVLNAAKKGIIQMDAQAGQFATSVDVKGIERANAQS